MFDRERMSGHRVRDRSQVEVGGEWLERSDRVIVLIIIKLKKTLDTSEGEVG